MNNKGIKTVLSLSVLISLALSPAVSANVTDKDILNDQATTGDVVSYGCLLYTSDAADE